MSGSAGWAQLVEPCSQVSLIMRVKLMMLLEVCEGWVRVEPNTPVELTERTASKHT